MAMDPLIKTSTLESFLGSEEHLGLAGGVVTTELADPSGYGRIVRGC